MRVSHLFKDSYLPVNSVDVALVLNLVLFQDFDGHFVSSYDMRPLLDLSECSFSLGLTDDEASDLLSLAVLLLFMLLFFLTILVLRLHLVPLLPMVSRLGSLGLLIMWRRGRFLGLLISHCL